MAQKVHITKNGIVAYEWSGEVQQYVEVPVKHPWTLLRLSCHVDNDVTLRDIFKGVEALPELMNFIGQWAWCRCEAFHREAEKPPGPPTEVQVIEITKMFEYFTDLKHELDAEATVDVCGVGPADEHGCSRYALDFTPVNVIADLPVRLKPRMDIRADHKTVAEVPCSFSLLDVLGEIYYEISFHGSPESRDEKRGELAEAIAEVEAGTATLVEWKPEEKDTIQ